MESWTSALFFLAWLTREVKIDISIGNALPFGLYRKQILTRVRQDYLVDAQSPISFHCIGPTFSQDVNQSLELSKT